MKIENGETKSYLGGGTFYKNSSNGNLKLNALQI